MVGADLSVPPLTRRQGRARSNFNDNRTAHAELRSNSIWAVWSEYAGGDQQVHPANCHVQDSDGKVVRSRIVPYRDG